MTESRQVTQNRHDVLGLDPADVAVYSALLRLGVDSDATALAAAASLPPAATTAALDRLVGAGAVRRTAVGHLPVSPALAFGDRLAAEESLVRDARDLVGGWEDLHRAGGRVPTPSDLVEVIAGAAAIGDTVEVLTRRCRRSIRGFDTPPYVSEPGSARATEERRLRDGIELQVVYAQEAASLPGRMEHDILPSIRAGEQARIAATVPMKLLLLDDEVAVLPVVAGGEVRQAAFVVRSTALVAGLVALFDLVWQTAWPVGVEPAPDAASTSEDDRTLLALLAAGQTDARIARALGTSERTVQRRAQRLFDGLGARTRFQAGVAAHARGRVRGL